MSEHDPAAALPYTSADDARPRWERRRIGAGAAASRTATRRRQTQHAGSYVVSPPSLGRRLPWPWAWPCPGSIGPGPCAVRLRFDVIGSFAPRSRDSTPRRSRSRSALDEKLRELPPLALDGIGLRVFPRPLLTGRRDHPDGARASREHPMACPWAARRRRGPVPGIADGRRRRPLPRSTSRRPCRPFGRRRDQTSS